MLADKFEHGALSCKNKVKRFDTAFLNISGCSGCEICRNQNVCFKEDDFNNIKKALLNSDVVVFVTPVYYFGMSAQLKMVIDRFHSISKELQNKSRKTILMMTAASPNKSVADALILHYKMILKYLRWENLATLLATACPTREEIERSDYPCQARKLGEDLHNI